MCCKFAGGTVYFWKGTLRSAPLHPCLCYSLSQFPPSQISALLTTRVSVKDSQYAHTSYISLPFANRAMSSLNVALTIHRLPSGVEDAQQGCPNWRPIGSHTPYWSFHWATRMPVWSLLDVNYPNSDLGVDRNCTQRGSESSERLAPYSTARILKQATDLLCSLLSCVLSSRSV